MEETKRIVMGVWPGRVAAAIKLIVQMTHYLLLLPLWLRIGLPVGAVVVTTVFRHIVRSLLEEFQTLLDQIVP